MEPSQQRVLVTGGTGFVGRYVTEALLNNGCNVRLITRHPERDRSTDTRVEWIPGDIKDPDSLVAAAADCDAIVHLVGIIEEVRSSGITFDAMHVKGTQHVVDAAEKAGVRTFVHMSANGASETGRTAYQQTKWMAEQIVKNGDFDKWTIFRPSLIFGKPYPGLVEFATRVRDTLIKPFPIWPVPGKGDYRLQPIAVQEVAAAFARAVTHPPEINATFCAGGPEQISYLEILDLIADASGEKIRTKLFQPIWGMRPVVSLLAPTGLLPITPAQLELLVGGNTCNDSSFADTFGPVSTHFNKDSLSYLST